MSVFDQLKLWEIYKPELGGRFQNMQSHTYLVVDGPGGGKEPVVFGRTEGNNNGQLWHCLTYGQRKTVLIYNKESNRIIIATDRNKEVACPVATEALVRDEASHWHIDWVPLMVSGENINTIRFRNSKINCVLDLADGRKDDGAPVYAWQMHQEGDKQWNQFWKYTPEHLKV